MKRIVAVSVFFVVLILVWEALVRFGVWSPVLVPSPLSVVQYLVRAIADGSLGHAVLVTLRRLLLGYVIGIAVGLPLGLLNARFK
ncbi:MAG: ABC transporter permease, partial [Verrucomicrobia bacterium]|nr:ABC transporter permease [Verrucomicrobiota bacterium]